jgi:hypothetical protein
MRTQRSLVLKQTVQLNAMTELYLDVLDMPSAALRAAENLEGLACIVIQD